MLSRLKTYWKRNHAQSYRQLRKLWKRFWMLSYPLYEWKCRMNNYRDERRHVESEVGYYPSLDPPRTINEKILYKKINNRNPLLTETADKLKVREYVREKLGSDADDILIPVLDTADDPSALRFSAYDIPYVVKGNHGWNMNLFVKQKISEETFVVARENADPSEWSTLDLQEECRRWLGTTHGFKDHQWAYLNIPPKLFIEPFLPHRDGPGLMEIKLDCFHGTPRFVYVIVNDGTERVVSVTDTTGTKFDVRSYGKENVSDEALASARSVLPALNRWSARLSEDFDFCRVDFYLAATGVYFSEITHYPNSGRRNLRPREFELEIGRHWNLDEH